jgi:DNA-binding transcriptional LysR family regulator
MLALGETIDQIQEARSRISRGCMDRLESMSVFVAVVEAGSFSACSRRLSMPLATVSRKVGELEQHLKTRLLERTSRRLDLTDVGRAYLAACKTVLENIAEAERVASGQYGAARGELTLTAPIVFGRLHVLPVLAEFLRVFPEIDVRFVLSDRVANLLEDRIDLALRIGELPDSNAMAVRIGQVSRVICGSPEYLSARGMPRKPSDLARHDCVTFEGLSSAQTWTFGQGKKSSPIRVHSRVVVNTAEAAIDAAIAGVGVTRVLSYQVSAALRSGALRRVLRAFEPAPVPVHLVYAARPLLPAKLRAFLDFAAPRLKARL